MAIPGLDAAVAELEAMELRLSDFSPVMGPAAKLVEAEMLEALPRKSGALAETVFATPDARGFTFGATADYAGYINWGTSRSDPRPFVPVVGTREKVTGLEPELDARVRTAVEQFVQTGSHGL